MDHSGGRTTTGPWARVREAWRASLTLRVLRALGRADAGALVALLALLATSVLASVGFVLSIGALVGRLPDAVEAGSGSPEAGGAWAALGLG